MPKAKTTTKNSKAESSKNNGRYIEGLGRRKRSVARVRIYQAKAQDAVAAKGFQVNGQDAKEYFQDRYYPVCIQPLEKASLADRFTMSVHVNGGGVTGQAEAVRMGLARALVEHEESLRGKLKRAGYLSRDPREKERRKYGLKKARRAPQFSKR